MWFLWMMRRWLNRSLVRLSILASHPVSTWGCMPWWWWNTGDNHACHWWYTSSPLHWTHQSHHSLSSIIPLYLHSSRPKAIPIISFHPYSCVCGISSWFVSHSSTLCTCFHLRCDDKWVHTQGMIESHPKNVLLRLCNQKEWRTCFVMFLVSSSSCSWIQAIAASFRIHEQSTRTRDNVHSMLYFLQ